MRAKTSKAVPKLPMQPKLFDKTIEDEEGNTVTIPCNERTFGGEP